MVDAVTLDSSIELRKARPSVYSSGWITAAILSLSNVELVEDERILVSVSYRLKPLAADSFDRANATPPLEEIVRWYRGSVSSGEFAIVVVVIAVVGCEEEKKDGKVVLLGPAVSVTCLRRVVLDGDLCSRDSEGKVSRGGGIGTGLRIDTSSFKGTFVAIGAEALGRPLFTEKILLTPLIALL